MKTKQYIEEINQFSQQLSEDNQAKLGKIVVRLRFSSVEEKQAEEFSHHCMDMFLQAEQEGRPVEELLGTDNLEKFCNEFITSAKTEYSPLQKIYLKIKYIPLLLLIFTGIFEMFIGTIVSNWPKTGFSLTIPVTVSMLLDTVVAGIALHFLVSRMNVVYEIMDENDPGKNKILNILLGAFFIGVIVIFVISKLLFKQTLFTVSFPIFMLIVGAICIAQYFLEERLN